MEERRKQDLTAEADGIIEGRNAVIEALRAGETIDKIYLQKGETDKTLGHIASKARAAGVVVVEADRRKLDAMSRTHAHQGVIALAAVREYVSVESILQAARDKGEAPLLVVCDEISDPHNLGAIIRTAECAGAHGVVIPKRRSAGLTAVVAKTSAGAVAHVPVARVPNIPALLKDLKKQGVWVFGTAADGTTALYDADLFVYYLCISLRITRVLLVYYVVRFTRFSLDAHTEQSLKIRCFLELSVLSCFLNTYSNSNCHTNHRVVTCSDQSHHFYVCRNR